MNMIVTYYIYSTAEPLDKNRLRIFQPTLGFLSAIWFFSRDRGFAGHRRFQIRKVLRSM